MPYQLPTFNLQCGIWWHYATPLLPPPLLGVNIVSVCNLQFAKKLAGQEQFQGAWLLLPPLTDIRPPSCYGGAPFPLPDWVEVPFLSGRYYVVVDVDDLAKGFPTEHRVANLTKRWWWFGYGGTFVDPIPWP